MTTIPPEAIQAAAEVLAQEIWADERFQPDHQEIARLVIEAIESVWPHDPPKRDPASTVSGSVTIRSQPAFYRRDRQEPGRTEPFGFGRDIRA